MGNNVDCGIVGYSPTSTCIRLDPSESTGPYWHRVLPLSRGKHLILDLSLIQDAQSNLVQDLQVMTSMLQRKQMSLILNNVPISVVGLLGEKKSALGDIQVMNLIAPYRCAACKRDETIIVPLGADLSPSLAEQIKQPEAIACQSCSGAMTFEGDHKIFFSSAALLRCFTPEPSEQKDLALAIQDVEGTAPRDRMSMSQNLSRHVWWLGLDQANQPQTTGGKESVKWLSREMAFAAALLVVNVILFVWLVSRID